MSMVSGNQSSTLTLSARLAEVFDGLGEAYRAWRIYRRTLAELRGLGPRALADLGLHRSGIRAAALEAAYGKVH